MPLNGYSSLCEERQRIIVSRYKRTRREHRAVNPDSCHVSQYKIDGNVVSDSSIRCDYLVMNEDRRNAYLIELKGSDIEHALDQLEVTAERLQKQLQGYCIRYRLVCSRVGGRRQYAVSNTGNSAKNIMAQTSLFARKIRLRNQSECNTGNQIFCLANNPFLLHVSGNSL